MTDLQNKSVAELEALRADVDAALAARKAESEVDPLLIEAREVCAKWCEERQAPDSAVAYRKGFWDDASLMVIALAALRRGMELSPRAAMGEDEIEAALAVWKEQREDDEWTMEKGALKRALGAAIRATLARVPVAAWPEPKPEPEWIEWHGGECPVPAGTRTKYKLRLHGEMGWTSTPELLRWQHSEDSESLHRNDITAYRILGADQ